MQSPSALWYVKHANTWQAIQVGTLAWKHTDVPAKHVGPLAHDLTNSRKTHVASFFIKLQVIAIIKVNSLVQMNHT